MGVWAWTPSLEEFDEGLVTKTLISDMGGKEKRISTEDPRRTYKFTYSAVDEDTADAMYNFFLEHRGQAKSFIFIHPKTSEIVNVRFDMAAISKKSFYFIVSNVGINLIEVL
jgi:hypothetical protein